MNFYGIIQKQGLAIKMNSATWGVGKTNGCKVSDHFRDQEWVESLG
jgi:hypothetical protein